MPNLDRDLNEARNLLAEIQFIKVYDIECKSLPQLYYQLAKKINEIIRYCNEVNGVIHEEVKDMLRVIIEDGTFAELVNTVAFEELKNELDKLAPNMEFYLDNFADDVEDEDWAPVLQDLINKSSKGTAIILGAKTYNLKHNVTTNKSVRLIGQGANNTTLQLSADVTLAFEGTKEQFIALSTVGLNNMTISGSQASMKPLIRFKYVGIGASYNLVLNDGGGGGIEFVSSQDMTFVNVYVRRCGNHERNFAAVSFQHASDGSTSENCNEIKFLNSTFEHNNGRLIKSDYSYNNSLAFIGCKFEYNNTDVYHTEEPVYIYGGDRIIFDDCRFTHYPSNGFIKMINTTSSSINGYAFNNDNPTNFANLEGCTNIKIECWGRKVGAVAKNNRCYYIYEELHDRETRNHSLMDLCEEGQLIGFDKLHYRDEGSTIDNGKVSGSGSTRKIIFPKITSHAVEGGMTILLKASSTESRQYQVKLRTSNGDKTLPNIHVNTTTGLLRIPIPFEHCRAGSFSLMIFGTNDTSVLTVEKIGYEMRYTTVNAAPTVAGLKGDIAWNTFPTVGDYIGWVCIATGTTWAGFGKVDNI